MKKTLTIALASLCLFTSSRSMDLPPTLATLAQQGNDDDLKAFISEYGNNISTEEALNALEIVIKQGYTSMIPSLLALSSDSEDHVIPEDVVGDIITCAAELENEAFAVSILEEIFKYPYLSSASTDDSHDAFKAAITLKHLNVITTLYQSHKLCTSSGTLIRMSCNQNYPDLAIFLLREMTNKKLVKKLSHQALCTAAKDSRLEFLHALLAEPEITAHLDTQNLTVIGQAVLDNQGISDSDKQAIKTTLEALAYSKGRWCIIS